MPITTIRVFEAPGNPYNCLPCGQGYDTWYGTRTFQFLDPLPANSIIQKITVNIYGTACYSVPTTVSINNETIGTGQFEGICSCDDCSQLTLSKNFTDGFSNYVSTGYNNLGVNFEYNYSTAFPSFIDVTLNYVTEINALVDIDPDTINLRSIGQFITAYIELPPCYDPQNIDINTVRLKLCDTVLSALPTGYEIVDYDNDGINELAVKFDRQSVINAVLNLTPTVTGQLNNGTTFSGEDAIRVICPGTPSGGNIPSRPCPILQPCHSPNMRPPLIYPLQINNLKNKLNTNCNCHKANN